MKRLLVLAAATAVALIAFGSPAQAGAPGYTKQGTYGHGDQCLGIGSYGQTNHQWTSYYCETITPATWSAPGLYELWVA